jgi:hypothetical protein
MEPNPTEAAPLELVVSQVKEALLQYQSSLGSGPDSLPPLSKAEFNFKTTTATTANGSINLFVFKIGGSHENDVVNDVTYVYAVPKPKKSEAQAARAPGKKKSVDFKTALVETIQSAARAVKTTTSLGKLPFSQLAVNLQYGVKWDGNIGVNVPIHLVTVGLGGDKSKNTIQSVKLTFGTGSSA